jgi:tetratricopeptide (TPR) repeat protein
MVTYYHSDELTDLSRQLVVEAFESEDIRQGLARAANEAPELRTLLETQGMPAPDLPEKPRGAESCEELIQIRRHFESDDFEAVIRLVDSVIATDPRKPIINPVAEAKAIIWKGLAKGRLGDAAAAIKTYDTVVARFGDSADRQLQVQVARALVNKGVTQGELGDAAAAIETYNAVVARFGDSADRELQGQVAWALVIKGLAQSELGDAAAAIETYDVVVARFGDSTDGELQDAVSGAIRKAAESLCMIGKAEDALRKADELRALGRRAHSAMPVAHATWVEAMARALLGETKRVEELFRQIRSAFDRDNEDMLRTFQEDVPTLVAFGADPGVLAGILEEDKETHDALRPLAVALRLEAGEKVRAPAEMLEVAADIRAAIEEKRRQRNR